MEQPVSDSGAPDASTLHQALVDKLKSDGYIRSPRVEAAFRAVPRHLFLPRVALDTVYSDTHIVTKERDGQSISSSSQPAIMAIMLELLDLRSGQRVLEIGAGTGYNAALMAHIVGDTGRVVTVDLDEDIVAAARSHLQVAGFEQVQVVCGDGGLGFADEAPYDRIILTVGAADIALAWQEQVMVGGRLVLPLEITRLHSLFAAQLLLAFDRVDDHIESVAVRECAFVRLRGACATPSEEPVALGPEPGLNLVTNTAGDVDANAVYALLTGPSHDEEIGMRATPRMLWGLHLWLALCEPRFCALYALGDMTERGIVPVLQRRRDKFIETVGLYDGTTLCLLTHPPDQLPSPALPLAPDSPLDLVVRRFGPDTTLTQRLREQAAAWEAAGRPFAWSADWTVENLRIRAYPREAAYTPAVNELVVDQRSARLVFAMVNQGS